MSEAKEPKGERINTRNSSCRDSGGWDRLIDQVTGVWFNDNFNDWKPRRRFFFALLGSLTLFVFLIPAIQTRIYEQLPSFFIDPELNTIISTFSFIFVVGLSLFYAGIVSWRNEKSGPVRMYLAGLTLPALVWFIVERTVN